MKRKQSAPEQQPSEASGSISFLDGANSADSSLLVTKLDFDKHLYAHARGEIQG